MRDKVERPPVAGTVDEYAEAARWTVDNVLAKEEELRRLQERFEIRGRLLIRIRRIVNTFQNAELAVKSIRDRLNGLDMGDEQMEWERELQ